MNGALQQLIGLVFMVAILQAQGMSSSCDLVTFQSCVEQLEDYRRKSEGGLVLYEDKELDNMCRTFDDIGVCVRRATSTCSTKEHSTLVRKFWLGLNSSLTFLCHNGKQSYLKLQKCFFQPRFEASIKNCNKTLHMSRQFSHSDHEHCLLEREFLQCISTWTEEHCGPEAALFERTIVKKMKEPSMAMKDCTLNSPELRCDLLFVITTLILQRLFERTC